MKNIKNRVQFLHIIKKLLRKSKITPKFIQKIEKRHGRKAKTWLHCQIAELLNENNYVNRRGYDYNYKKVRQTLHDIKWFYKKSLNIIHKILGNLTVILERSAAKSQWISNHQREKNRQMISDIKIMVGAPTDYHVAACIISAKLNIGKVWWKLQNGPYNDAKYRFIQSIGLSNENL